MTPPNSVSSSYIPPSQRSGSEASIAITQSSSFAPLALSSVDSQLLPIPNRPNAPLTSASMAQSVTHTASTSKGKQRAQSIDDLQDFTFSDRRQGFYELKAKLQELQAPLQESLSIASMENSEFTMITTDHARQISHWFAMLTTVTDKAAKSLDYCPEAAQLPPYPALGLAWTALANSRNSINISASKAVHALVNSITIVNVNKQCPTKPVPVPVIPGIQQPQQVAIRP